MVVHSARHARDDRRGCDATSASSAAALGRGEMGVRGGSSGGGERASLARAGADSGGVVDQLLHGATGAPGDDGSVRRGLGYLHVTEERSEDGGAWHRRIAATTH
jgi:hypothetical protein